MEMAVGRMATVFGVADVERVLSIARKFPIFPCGPDKRPRVASGFHAATQDEKQIRQWWRQWPDALVGVPTGQTTGLVVIDYDPDKATSATHSWIAEHTELLCSTRNHKTGRGGLHYLFRSTDRYQTGVDLVLGGSPRRGIDLRANGGYVIWWPAHVTQGDETPVAPLPANLIDERRFDAQRDMAPLPKASPAQWRAERTRAREALGYVAPDGYENWIRVGMAVHSASGGSDDGFALWHDWSATAANYDGIEDCRYHWASFGRYQGRGIGLGSLYAQAKEAGFSPAPSRPELPPADVYEDEQTRDSDPAPPPELEPIEELEVVDDKAGPDRRPIDWTALVGAPPARTWAIPHWLGIGFVTMLAGPGGVGKTLLAQQLASSLATGDPLIAEIPQKRKVLMWAGEDENDELWRRQFQIAGDAGRQLSEYKNLVIESYAGRDCSLAEPVFGTLGPTPMLKELTEQVADYDVDVVILDNVARLYGGNENERHQVTQFLNWVTGACNARRPVAVLLLSHPAKANGSEYAGSTAWEAAVRSRWYFGRTLPDQEEGTDTDPNLRYLSRRKSNYSALDTVRMRYDASYGLLRADADAATPVHRMHPAHAETTVLEALGRLVTQGVAVSDSPRHPNFMVKVMVDRSMADRAQERPLREALYRLMDTGKIVRKPVGQYANRSPRMGLAPAVSNG